MMKNSLKIIIAFGLIGLVALTIPSFAQNPPAEPAADVPVEAPAVIERTPTGAPKTKCVEELMPKVVEKREAFAQFITQHFQSDKKNSELLPVAVDRFRQFVKEVNEEADRAFIIDEQGVAAEKILERGACQQKIDDELFLMKEVLRKHILSTAHAKKTTQLLDAYKELNSKLDKLNYEMSQMYGYMETFSTKIPCYVESCS